jgi:hypothetical protein
MNDQNPPTSCHYTTSAVKQNLLLYLLRIFCEYPVNAAGIVRVTVNNCRFNFPRAVFFKSELTVDVRSCSLCTWFSVHQVTKYWEEARRFRTRWSVITSFDTITPNTVLLETLLLSFIWLLFLVSIQIWNFCSVSVPPPPLPCYAEDTDDVFCGAHSVVVI